MYKKINENYTPNNQTIKNDLYRKFHKIFDKLIDSDYDKPGLHTLDTYVQVNPSVEEGIFDFLSSEQNSLLPIIGPTGIGKTFILNYCLKTVYKKKTLLTNCPQLFIRENEYDLVYYSDFKISNPFILSKVNELFFSKIKTLNDFLSQKSEDLFEFGYYENPTKNDNGFSEIYNYPANEREYQKNLQKLSSMLDQSSIKKFIFIFDDIESLNEKDQYSLIDSFLKFYEYLNTKCLNCNIKFIFCTRTNTYYGIYKCDFYNTHRGKKSLRLIFVPKLSKLFHSRFETIEKDENIEAKNLSTWRLAEKILIDLSDRIDTNYSNLLLNLRNLNIPRALDDFVNILTNRHWTQKNLNVKESFVISEGEYYISDANILRILSMGEDNVYQKNMEYPIKCILPNPGYSFEEDYITFLILRMFKKSCPPNKTCSYNTTNLLSEDDVTNYISNLIVPNSLSYNEKLENKEKIKLLVHKVFEYYEENHLIHLNTDPRINKNNKYFLLPRGEQIFDLFFSNSILFSIFRDEYTFNDQRYNIKYSHELTIDAIFEESIKYCEDLLNVESEIYNKVIENNMQKNYFLLFGNWSFSSSFFGGIEASSKMVYKEDIPNNLQTKLNSLKDSVENLCETIGKTNGLF